MSGPIRLLLILLLTCSVAFSAGCRRGTAEKHAALPAEARQTLRLIKKGGPFPYRRDGVVFHNRERHLPGKPPGYYREYTVPTPGVRHRGARRLIVGQRGEVYYTSDHYRSFSKVE